MKRGVVYIKPWLARFVVGGLEAATLSRGGSFRARKEDPYEPIGRPLRIQRVFHYFIFISFLFLGSVPLIYSRYMSTEMLVTSHTHITRAHTSHTFKGLPNKPFVASHLSVARLQHKQILHAAVLS